MINLYWKTEVFLLSCALMKIKEHNEIKRERERERLRKVFHNTVCEGWDQAHSWK